MAIPWNEERPRLLQARANGVGIQAIADDLSIKYEPISAQAVRQQLITHEQRTHTPREEGNIVNGLREAVTRMGRENDFLSGAEYDRWRKQRERSERNAYPSVETLRRHYGTWNSALKAASLPFKEPHRTYLGLTRTDAVLWVSVWLRSIRENGGHPTMATYRLFTKNTPLAPSGETLRRFGRWSSLLKEATEVEEMAYQRGTDLPTPAPVGQQGRRKTPLSIAQ